MSHFSLFRAVVTTGLLSHDCPLIDCRSTYHSSFCLTQGWKSQKYLSLRFDLSH